MKSLKLIAPAIFVCIISFMMFSCSKSDANNPSGNNNIYKVNIQANLFDPANLTMLAGSKVTWTNMDNQVHSLIADDGISFSSGSINPGGTYSFTPAATGTYAYHCGIHPTVQGIIYVVIR